MLGDREEKKIKVLHFPIANSKGGITQYVLRNWQMIDKSRFHFDFATMSKTLDFEQELINGGCRVHYISCYAEENKEKFVDEFRQILIEGNYDIVHLHTKQWKSFEVEKIAKEVGVKRIIVHAHSSGINAIEKEKEEEEKLLHNKMREMLDETIATDFWACSQAAAEWLYGNRINEKKIQIIPNAIDTKRFSYQATIRNEIRKNLQIENKFVLGHVGRFDFVKNHIFLLEILKRTIRFNPNVILLLVGAGALEKEIREKANELEIGKNILMVGKSEEPELYLQAMDLFVFPSLFEGFPLSVIEAQCAGLKCICSEAITKEIMLTNNVEFLALEDVDIWVEKVLNLFSGYERESQNELIEQRGFDIHKQIRQVEEFYCGREVC